jgi:hypothetical protein
MNKKELPIRILIFSLIFILLLALLYPFCSNLEKHSCLKHPFCVPLGYEIITTYVGGTGSASFDYKECVKKYPRFFACRLAVDRHKGFECAYKDLLKDF